MEKPATGYCKPEIQSDLRPAAHDGYQRTAELESGALPDEAERETSQHGTLVHRVGARFGRFVRRVGQSRQPYVSHPPWLAAAAVDVPADYVHGFTVYCIFTYFSARGPASWRWSGSMQRRLRR